MSIFPHTRLWVGPSRSVVVSGPHIQIVDTRTGDIVSSTGTLLGDDRDALLKSGPVRCAAVDSFSRYLAAAGDDKILKLWGTDGPSLKLLNTRELPKKSTAIMFSQDSQTIIVSDKFGDVFSYSLHPASPTPPERPKRDGLSSHENPSGGRLVLGHASLLTSLLLTPDERYIITADRDEHIRVSWYPQGYCIERYCLGHEKFVSAIHIPPSSPSSLISGGGDSMLKIWDWMSGKVLREIVILDTVKPFIKVRAPTRKRGDGKDEEVPQRSNKGKHKQEKGKAKAKDTIGLPTPMAADLEMGPSSIIPGPEPTETNAKLEGESGNFSGSQTDAAVLVVNKIDSVTSKQTHHIIFSAIGATALFACQYPDVDTTPTIQTFDLGRPVLDFTVTEDECIWTLLDTEMAENSSGDEAQLVRVLGCTGGQLVERTPGKYTALLNSLNTKCRLPASPADLQSLDLYSALTSMPKNAEVAHNPMDRDFPDASLADDEDGLAETPQGRQMSKKELGRLKHKRALLAKVQGGVKADSDGGEGDEPELKKTRSDEGDGVD